MLSSWACDSRSRAILVNAFSWWRKKKARGPQARSAMRTAVETRRADIDRKTTMQMLPRCAALRAAVAEKTPLERTCAIATRESLNTT